MKTYLFSIARNLALKQFRDSGGEDPLDDAMAPEFDPRAALDIASAVSAAVAGLPALQQEALILFEYEGVTLEEIAKIVTPMWEPSNPVASPVHVSNFYLQYRYMAIRENHAAFAAVARLIAARPGEGLVEGTNCV